MTHPILHHIAWISLAVAAMPASAENHVAQPSFGAPAYASDDCNHEAEYLETNNISCVAIFADTNVWDFLENLPRRISLATLTDLNPRLGPVEYTTVIKGITFVRVR